MNQLKNLFTVLIAALITSITELTRVSEVIKAGINTTVNTVGVLEDVSTLAKDASSHEVNVSKLEHEALRQETADKLKAQREQREPLTIDQQPEAQPAI